MNHLGPPAQIEFYDHFRTMAISGMSTRALILHVIFVVVMCVNTKKTSLEM